MSRLTVARRAFILFIGIGLALSSLRAEDFTTEFTKEARAFAFPLNVIVAKSLIISFASFIVAGAVALASFFGDMRFRWSKLFVAFALCNLWPLIRSAAYDSANFSRLIFAAVLSALCCLILAKKNSIQDFKASILVCASVFVLLHAYQFSVNPAILIWNGRWMGITPHPNHLGVYSAALGVYILPDLFFEKRRFHLFYKAGLEICLLMLMILSASRTGLLVFIVGFTTLMLKGLGKKIKAIYVVVFAIIIAVSSLGYSIYQGMQEKDEDQTARLVSSDNTRALAWSTQLEEFSNAPILGNGITTYTESSLFSSFVVGGVISGAAYIYFVILNFYSIKFAEIPRDGMQAARYGIVAASSGLLIGSLFEGYGLMALQVYSLGGILILMNNICMHDGWIFSRLRLNKSATRSEFF